MNILYLPFIVQGILMAIDENIHSERGLGWWERIGHPLDTLSVLVPMAYIYFNDFSPERLMTFVLLALFSCVFVTKDEYVHHKTCGIPESWLHAILYIFHPVVFMTAGFLWKYSPNDKFLLYQPMIIGGFMIYQLLRWSIPWKEILK